MARPRPTPAIDDHVQESAWQNDAACKGDNTLWFSDEAAAVAEAKRVCRTSCNVRSECLEYALVSRERHGIWGGMGEKQRRRLVRLRAEIAGQPAEQEDEDALTASA